MKLLNRILRHIKKLLGIKSPSGVMDEYRYNKEFWHFIEIDLCDEFGIMPAPMSSDTAMDVLVSYLLGEDWYVAASINGEQCNTVAVAQILNKYSKKYRKDIAHYCEKAGEKSDEY